MSAGVAEGPIVHQGGLSALAREASLDLVQGAQDKTPVCDELGLNRVGKRAKQQSNRQITLDAS